jgi:hypothetical protein
MSRGRILAILLVVVGCAAGAWWGVVVGEFWGVYREAYEFPSYERARTAAYLLGLAGLAVGLAAGFMATRKGARRVAGLAVVGVLVLGGIGGAVEGFAFYCDHVRDMLVESRLAFLIRQDWSDDLLLQDLSLEPMPPGRDLPIGDLVLRLPEGWPEPAAGDVPNSVVAAVPSAGGDGLEATLVYLSGLTEALATRRPFDGMAGPPDIFIAGFKSHLDLFEQAYRVRPAELEWAVGKRRRRIEALLWLRLDNVPRPAWLLEAPALTAIVSEFDPGHFWAILFDPSGRNRGDLVVRFSRAGAEVDMLSLVGQIMWHGRFAGAGQADRGPALPQGADMSAVRQIEAFCAASPERGEDAVRLLLNRRALTRGWARVQSALRRRVGRGRWSAVCSQHRKGFVPEPANR